MKDKYVAFYKADWETETFQTYEEAEKWLIEYDSQDAIAEESLNGDNFIARITHRSHWVEADRKEYYHEHADDCPVDCDEEEWPYDCEFDVVGRIEYREVKEKN